MSNRLPCHIVRDMLPQYAEHLLSEESEQDVRSHLDECEECRALYKKLTAPLPIPESDKAEVDYLKKIRNGRKKLLISALAAVVLIAAVLGIYFRGKASHASVSYDPESKTMVIYGKDDSELKLPDTVNEAVTLDAQYDSFHLKVWLPLLRTDGQPLKTYLPEYLNRTKESLKFLRSYMKENCTDEELALSADKYVNISVHPEENYSWAQPEDSIDLDIGSFYWHREELYILSLINEKNVYWKQLGYAWYLGACIDPYSENLVITSMENLKDARYYDAYVRAGGTDTLTPENYRILNDAISYICLTEGMHWGSAYESTPLRNTALYHGPAKTTDPGNEMSVCMATSFIAWLSDSYGFETVTAFCFGQKNFKEAFGTDFSTAYESWSQSVIETCG